MTDFPRIDERSDFGRRTSRFILRMTMLCGIVFPGPASLAQETQDDVADEPEDHASLVFVADPDGSKMRLLSFMPEYRFQGSSEWSRDGKLIAFDTWRGTNGEEGVRYGKIGIVDADGGDAKILGDGVMPSLSPEGDRLAFSHSGKGVLLMDLSGDAPETELIDASGWGTAWSPDGASIAYGRGGNLVIYDIAKDDKRTLFNDEASPYQYIKWNFAWSADSSKIAFQGVLEDKSTILAIVDARGAEFGHTIRYIGAFEPTLCWSPDGNQILFAANCPQRNNLRQIYSINPNDWSPPYLLPEQATNRSITDMTFSPDGTTLTFTASRPVKTE